MIPAADDDWAANHRQMSVQMDAQTYAIMQRLADEQGCSMGEVIRRLIRATVPQKVVD